MPEILIIEESVFSRKMHNWGQAVTNDNVLLHLSNFQRLSVHWRLRYEQ